MKSKKITSLVAVLGLLHGAACTFWPFNTKSSTSSRALSTVASSSSQAQSTIGSSSFQAQSTITSSSFQALPTIASSSSQALSIVTSTSSPAPPADALPTVGSSSSQALSIVTSTSSPAPPTDALPTVTSSSSQALSVVTSSSSQALPTLSSDSSQALPTSTSSPSQTLPVVTIASGVVVGTTTLLASATAVVNKFLGIPYAQSPPLRWAPPQPPTPWTQPLPAQLIKDACMQEFVYPAERRLKAMAIFDSFYSLPPAESEDCLYINVWTPSNITSSSKLPVMFWIYGGNFQFGSGGIGPYDGSSFAYNQGVIVVTFNWRTNIFGFPSSPEIPFNQRNVGLLDQRFALAWVQNNIAAFGGDPNKVTIFGESSGGWCVKQLLARPPVPLPFRAAIIQSSAAFFSGNSSANWAALANGLNCSSAPSPLACLRQVDPLIIKYFIELNAQTYPPVFDGATLVPDVRPAFQYGTAVKVPIMIGTLAQESRPFAYCLGLGLPNSNLTQFLQMVLPNNTALQLAIAALFPVTELPFRSISQVMTDSTFTCTTSALSSIAQQAGYQIWRYFYNSEFPNLQPFPDAGVWHSSEIPIVFGNYPLLGVTRQQILLSKNMQTMWANFAKNPSAGPGWPSYGGLGYIGQLGGNAGIFTSGVTTVLSSSVDSSCPVYNPIIANQAL